MIYNAHQGQVQYGSSIGILMLDSFIPFIPGDVGNASTFSFPVSYKKVPGLTVQKMFDKKADVLPQILSASQLLIQEDGVQAITGNCGYLLLFQKELSEKLDVPVFTSSLLQLPFMETLIAFHEKIGILTAESYRFSPSFLQEVRVSSERIYVKGLETKPHFSESAIKEKGILDTEKLEREVVEASLELVNECPNVAMLLLECSLLPPYRKAVQEAIQLPVYDYVTMTNFVYHTLRKAQAP